MLDAQFVISIFSWRPRVLTALLFASIASMVMRLSLAFSEDAKLARNGVKNLDARMAELSEPLPEDKVYYRWQSTESGERLARLGRMNATTNAYFMGVTSGIAAGPGIYVAESPVSSSEYLPENGGNLLEVRIPKGTRVINIKDKAVVERMEKLGITTSELLAGKGSNKGLLINYSHDWFVGKNLQGKARFEFYPNAEVTPAQFIRTLRSAKEVQVQRQLARQLGARRPDLRASLARDGENLDVALHVATVDEAKPLLRQVISSHRVDPSEAWDLVALRPDLALSLLRDDVLRPSFTSYMRDLIKSRLPRGATADHDKTVFFEQILDDPHLTNEERAFVHKSLIKSHLSAPDAYKNPDALAARVLPLLDKVEFDPRERRIFQGALTGLVMHYEDELSPAPALHQLMKVADIVDPTLARRIDRVGHQRALVDRAVNEASAKLASAALASSTSINEIDPIMRQLDRRMPSSLAHEGMNDFIENNRARIETMIDVDFSRSAQVAAGLDNEALLEKVYHASLFRDVDEREDYFSECMQRPTCRSHFMRRARADRGLFFDRLERLNHFNLALADITSDLSYVKQMHKLMITTARSVRQIEMVADAFGYRAIPDAYKKTMITQMRRIGMSNFTPQKVMNLLDTIAPAPAEANALIDAAFAGTVRPSDVAEIAKMAASHDGLGPEIKAAIARRAEALGASRADLESLEPRPNAPSPAPGGRVPATTCLETLTKISAH